VRLTPEFLRALQGRGTLRVPDTGREASRPYNRDHLWPTFYEIITFYLLQKKFILL
jgi:hypothetical protein